MEALARNFDEYMKNSKIAHHAHQQWICSRLPDGEMFKNRICRLETLRHDMNLVSDELNLPRWELPLKNSTSHKSYRDEMSKDARQVVERVYARDIEVFGYEF